MSHFGWQAGRGYTFFFTHNVALFFFISGCTENFNTEKSFLRYLVKKIKTVLLPTYFFALLAIAVTAIGNNAEWYYVEEQIQIIIKGIIRNQFMAESLWFLTCLFVMQILFFFIEKVKNKVLIFLVCLGIYYLSICVLPIAPLVMPYVYYNIDSALYYVIYYAIGYLAFPYIDKLFELDTLKKKLIYGVTGVISIYYAIRFFFGGDLLSNIPFPAFAQLFTPILAACIMIWAYLVLARLLQDVDALVNVGKNTLYLCGSECIAKDLMINFLSIFGIYPAVYTSAKPTATYLYVGILIFVINRYLVPIEKYILKKIIR